MQDGGWQTRKEGRNEDQDASWQPMEISLSRGGTVLDKDIQLPLPRKGHISPSTFRPTSIVAKRSPILATAELLFDHAAYRSHQQWDKTLWHSSQDSFRHLGQDSLALLSERS